MKRNLSKVVLTLLLVGMLLPGILGGVATAQPADWYDPAWDFRRPVEVSNPCGIEVTDFQVQVTLGSSFDFSKALPDGSDLRVTDSDGVTPVPFWIDDWDSTGMTASIWVKVPSIPTSGTTVYLYYGNAGASSASDGDATFEFFDDFPYSPLPPVPDEEWAAYGGNPITPGTHAWASIIKDDTDYKMYYSNAGGAYYIQYIGLKTSTDGINWTDQGSVLASGGLGTWDYNLWCPMAWKEGGTYHMMYTGRNGPMQIGHATSADGYTWIKDPANPVFNDPNAWANDHCENWGVIKIDSIYYMWYNTLGSGTRQVGVAMSTDLVTWTPSPSNPLFGGGRFCAFPFKYDSYYYLLVPHYTSGSDYSVHELYRCPNPGFLPAERELVREAIRWGSAPWDNLDLDTPCVLTDDIYRDSFMATGDELWAYYAGTGAIGWTTGLRIETDIASALEPVVLPPPPPDPMDGKWTLDAVNDITHETDNYFRFKDAAKSVGDYWVYNGTDTGSQHQADWIPSGDFVVEWESSLNNMSQMGQGCVGLVASDDTVVGMMGYQDWWGGSLMSMRAVIGETAPTNPRAGVTLYSGGGGGGFSFARINVASNDSTTFKIVKHGSTLDFYDGDGKFCDMSISSIPSKLALVAGSYGGNPFFDYVQIDILKVRKYCGMEPFVELGEEEYPNQPPVADAGPDQTVEQTSNAGTSVTLDGSGSYDPDEDLLSYLWSAPGISFDDPTSPTPVATFPLGTTTVTLIVNDGCVDSDSDKVDITVEDTTPPEISISISPDKLWPPNHKMVDITATVEVSDICDSSPTVVLTSVVSDEPDDAKGNGDGKTVDDIQGADTGFKDYVFQLRAERAGNGDGRTYTITYTATDASGNSASTSVTVIVPHDKGKN